MGDFSKAAAGAPCAVAGLRRLLQIGYDLAQPLGADRARALQMGTAPVRSTMEEATAAGVGPPSR